MKAVQRFMMKGMGGLVKKVKAKVRENRFHISNRIQCMEIPGDEFLCTRHKTTCFPVRRIIRFSPVVYFITILRMPAHLTFADGLQGGVFKWV